MAQALCRGRGYRWAIVDEARMTAVVEQIVIASAVATVAAMGVAGVTFWLVLRAADEPSDPGQGRGRADIHRAAPFMCR